MAVLPDTKQIVIVSSVETSGMISSLTVSNIMPTVAQNMRAKYSPHSSVNDQLIDKADHQAQQGDIQDVEERRLHVTRGVPKISGMTSLENTRWFAELSQGCSLQGHATIRGTKHTSTAATSATLGTGQR